jgi:hypothetical protein
MKKPAWSDARRADVNGEPKQGPAYVARPGLCCVLILYAAAVISALTR